MTRAWFNTGVIEARIGNYELSNNAFDKVLSLDPRSALAWFNKGLVLTTLGSDRRAKTALIRANDAAPEFSERRNGVGGALYFTAKYGPSPQYH